MALSKKTRFSVFKRDGFICRYCGKRPPDTILEVDHVLPRAEGGGDEQENLVTACVDCNRGKGAEPLGEKLPHVDELEILAATQEIMERKAALEYSRIASEEARATEDDAIDTVVGWWEADTLREGRWLDRNSLRQFVRRMPLEEIRRAVSATARRSPGGNARCARYFYKVCWNIIREAEGEA